MRQTPNVVTVVDLEEGAANIGKCNMCTRIITNDPKSYLEIKVEQIEKGFFYGIDEATGRIVVNDG